MATVAGEDGGQTRVSKQAVAKQFVRLYYSILNTHNGYLYQFYGKSSSVTVSETLEENQTLTETAEDEQHLLESLYSDLTVKVDSAIPQFSVDDTVLLHINGTMQRKSKDDKRTFTQAIVLCPQENGYYIRTDVVHVLGFGHVGPILSFWDEGSLSQRAGTRVDNGIGASTENSDKDISIQIGEYRGGVIEDHVGHDIRTDTPPLEDTPRPRNASQESDHESEEAKPKRSSKSWIVRQQGTKASTSGAIATHPPVIPPVMMPPPVPMPPHPTQMAPMPYPMTMGPASRYMRQRSMSMGCDPWSLQSQTGYGVFIARLPFGIQPADVEEAFSAFGPIFGGRDGIQVRDGRNGCYAFVTFENAESARTAIQQGAVLQGKRVFIEPRYPRQEVEPTLVAYPTMIPQHLAAYPMHVPHPMPRMH